MRFTLIRPFWVALVLLAYHVLPIHRLILLFKLHLLCEVGFRLCFTLGCLVFRGFHVRVSSILLQVKCLLRGARVTRHWQCPALPVGFLGAGVLSLCGFSTSQLHGFHRLLYGDFHHITTWDLRWGLACLLYQ